MFSGEKLSLVLTLFKYDTFDDAILTRKDNVILLRKHLFTHRLLTIQIDP